MPLNFPDVEDIHLAKAPVREVICQVKFPIILQIAREEPAAFQEHVRERFPALETETGVRIELKGGKPPGPVSFQPPIHHFRTKDETGTISLAPDFYAVSTRDYQNWREFADNIAYAARAAQAVYAHPYATRIGLRYINMLDGTYVESGRFEDVLDLLRDELTVMLRTDVILSPEMALQRMQIPTDGEHFTFRYGLIHEKESREPRFVLDFDYYIEGKIGLNDLLARCNSYHRQIYNAFRWCIAEGKLDVFGPASANRKEV